MFDYQNVLEWKSKGCERNVSDTRIVHFENAFSWCSFKSNSLRFQNDELYAKYFSFEKSLLNCKLQVKVSTSD